MKASRLYLVCFLICAWTVNAPSRALAAPQADESVAELRDILSTPPTDPARRREDLNRWLAEPHSLTTLRRALLVPEWRVADPNTAVASIDRTGLEEVARQFQAGARSELRAAGATRQIAVLHTLADMSR